MLFTTIDFFIFLAALLGILAVVRNSRARYLIVLAASYLFYAAWDWRFLSLLIGVSFWNFYVGLLIEDGKTKAIKKAAMIVGVSVNLCALAYFKYANFFLDNFKELFGIHRMGALNIILPLGISFFTFQGVAYLVDIYRRVKPATRDLLMFLFFKAFFPQLIAGPIVRAKQFMPQLARPFRMKKLMIVTGSQYILMGVLSKTVFADNLAVAVDQIFAKPALYDVPTLWLGLVAYTGQVYCDFFGYSLMAVGLARIFGYRMPINFRTSYASLSINELWSRHHITLSNWLRDYLYISLGGNRKGEIRSYVNLMITMVLGGFWHGASWAFVLWGLMHGIAVSINRKWSKPLFGGSGFGKFVGWFLTFWFFVISMLPFRAFDTTTMVVYAKGMLNLNGAKATWLYTPALVLIGILVIWHLLYYFSRPWRKKKLVFQRWGTTVSVGFSMAVLFAILMYAQVAQAPFIYFQF